MDEKDSMTPDTIPQSTPVDGTVSAGRKNRRPVVIGVAAVAAVALAAAPVADVMLLAVQVLNLIVWACLLVRTRGGSL